MKMNTQSTAAALGVLLAVILTAHPARLPAADVTGPPGGPGVTTPGSDDKSKKQKPTLNKTGASKALVQKVNPGTKGGETGFNPQPDPPDPNKPGTKSSAAGAFKKGGDVGLVPAVQKPGTKGGEQGFNPQPEPPGEPIKPGSDVQKKKRSFWDLFKSKKNDGS